MRTTFLCVTCRASSSSRLNLALDFRGSRRVRHHVGTNHFDRDGDAQLRIPRLIDGAHAADAEHSNDVIARPERLPRLERPRRDARLWNGDVGRRRVDCSTRRSLEPRRRFGASAWVGGVGTTNIVAPSVSRSNVWLVVAAAGRWPSRDVGASPLGDVRTPASAAASSDAAQRGQLLAAAANSAPQRGQIIEITGESPAGRILAPD